MLMLVFAFKAFLACFHADFKVVGCRRDGAIKTVAKRTPGVVTLVEVKLRYRRVYLFV
jgi:hypothetical protein